MNTENQNSSTKTPSSQGGVIGKCIFVGMHNKPGMKPLDSRTMSGKMIDAIIKELPLKCTKTNLCEVEYLPIDEKEILSGNLIWNNKYEPTTETIIVLLGKWVHKNFLFTNANIVKLPHPASCMGNINKEKYVRDSVDKILRLSQIENPVCKKCIDKNGQNIGNMYVCDECGRLVP